MSSNKNGPASSSEPTKDKPPATTTANSDKKKTKKKKPAKPVLGVDFFRCFLCGEEGTNLKKCSQCEIAYYCNKTCQRGHWKDHKLSCAQAVAAQAEAANRERLARAVREKGKDNVEGAEEDEVCVICLGEPVNPVRLPCGHKYCKTCVEELRYGRACPKSAPSAAAAAAQPGQAVRFGVADVYEGVDRGQS